MSDIFEHKDAYAILKNKFVVVIGSSVQRSIYKDLVMLLQRNTYLTDKQLRAKGEIQFASDELLQGGKKEELNNGIHYREVRQFKTDYHLVRFYFVTRCYNNYVNSIFTELKDEPRPDAVIINSCLWDITRYGNNYVNDYKSNLEKLCECMMNNLTEKCLCVWNTTLPVSRKAKGGVIVPEVEHMMNSLQLEVLEANYVACQIVASHGLDVIDLQHFLRYHLHRRAEDGIHWDMTAHRRITNLILSHITEALGEELPNRTKPKNAAHSQNANKNNMNTDFSQTKNLPEHGNMAGNPVMFGVRSQNMNAVPNFSKNSPQLCLPVRPSGPPQDVAQQINYGQCVNIPSTEERYGGPIRKTNYRCFQDNQMMNGPEAPGMSEGHFQMMQARMYPVDFTENQQENFHEDEFFDQEPMVNSANVYENFGQNIEEYSWHPYERQQYHPPRPEAAPPRHRVLPYIQRRRGFQSGFPGQRGVYLQNVRFFR
ncbi:PC-esterase domain-containing protein 1B-like [Argopecten irradians]|uniref:PC-esterase domain-containing protein 1B-like n=1 Tax=Argopecten irradians TaxID=31199 RepID=UPI00371470C8